MDFIYTVLVTKEDEAGLTIHKKAMSFPDLERACERANEEIKDKWVISVEIIRADRKL